MQQKMQTEWEAYQEIRGVRVEAQQNPGEERVLKVAPVLPEASETFLDELLRDLNSADPSVHEVAMRTVRKMAAASPEQLLQLTHREADMFQKRVINGTLISLIAVSMVGTLGVMAAKLIPFFQNQPEIILYAVGLTSLLTALWLSVYVPRRARHRLVEVFSKLNDPRFIGPVLSILVPDSINGSDMSRTLNTHARTMITSALKEMLAHLRADQKIVLTPEQMQALLQLLNTPFSDPPLTLSVLRALQQIGDERAIPVVERLAQSASSKVSTAAAECLEYLRNRADTKRHSQTLLRASHSAQGATPEMLLRPATGTVLDDAPEQLLRPQA